jgi:hypothetical protein
LSIAARLANAGSFDYAGSVASDRSRSAQDDSLKRATNGQRRMAND